MNTTTSTSRSPGSDVTRLRYLREMDLLELESLVAGVEADAVLLEETIFYPQGGGQPYDQGFIVSPTARFRVSEVRHSDAGVRHIGAFESGSFSAGELVRSLVDAERRILHTRIHSAGHVVDMAVTSMEMGWVPGKGYHYPEGAYVEYAGALSGDPGTEIEKRCNGILGQGIETRLQFDGDQRTVYYGSFGVLCGGTHVARLADIGPIVIRKLKESKGVVRVSYSV